MKFVVVLVISFLTASSFAGTCKLSSGYYEGFHCATISTKLTVETVEECRDLALETRKNKFFGILTGKYEKVLRTKYTFKDKTLKIVDRIVFEDSEEYCGY